MGLTSAGEIPWTAKRLAVLAGRVLGTSVLAARRPRRLPCGCGGLLRLVGELPTLPKIDERLAAVERAFMATFGMPMAVFVPAASGVHAKYQSAGCRQDQFDAVHAAAALYSRTPVFRDGGPRAPSTYLPLRAGERSIGVLAFADGRARYARDWPLIRAFAGQTTLALLRSDLEEEARYAKATRDLDEFRKTLFDSIAHNVRTPLASIIGALSAIQEDGAALDGALRSDLVDTARQEADRLNRLLGNLLDLSRLESGTVRVRSDLCDVQDVIGAALEQLGPSIRGRNVVVSLPSDMPSAPMDFVLIVQVIVNLLDNAMKYSQPDSPILIEARHTGAGVSVSVSDDGEGIPGDHPERAFNKFDRAGRSGEIAGLGLGLSICRAFVEAHRGSIAVQRRRPRGTTVAFTIPARARSEEAATA